MDPIDPLVPIMWHPITFWSSAHHCGHLIQAPNG